MCVWGTINRSMEIILIVGPFKYFWNNQIDEERWRNDW